MFINVVIGVLAYQDRFLLVKRKKGNFPNLWGLIGGKVEDGEHLDEAIIRELKEETEINVQPRKLLGVTTEMVTDNGKTSSTVLFCWQIELVNIKNAHVDKETSWYSKNEKLELRWFTKDELSLRNDIVGSDLDFLNNFYFENKTNYLKVDCYRGENGIYKWEVI